MPLGDVLLPYNSSGDIATGGDWHPLVPVGFAPLLSIEKSDDPDSVEPGGALNYYIRVNNTKGINATNVIVTDRYDENVTFVAAVPAPSQANDTWIFARLNVNETKWINISVTVNSSTRSGTILHNLVNVTCEEGVTDSDVEATTVLQKELINCTCGDICVNETGWLVDGGAFHASTTPIQAAIENATAGETICVMDGTYNENVNVSKRLTIQSEYGYVNCIVNALNSDEPVFNVIANDVNIRGLTVKGGTGWLANGIFLDGVEHCNISDNKALDNWAGFYLRSSNNNTLIRNTANSNNWDGISLWNSSHNIITDNHISTNRYHGIWLRQDSNNNTLSSNTANSNDRAGIRLWLHSNNNTLSSNTANSNGKRGIKLDSSSNNVLTSNIANSNGDYGIFLDESSNNMLMSNTANSNEEYGIYLVDSSNNLLYNNYFNNTHNAYDDRNNVWNTTKFAGTNIIGGPYLGGNYWSDYAGIDNDGDGLGNTLLPYNSSGNITIGGDWHPLVPVGVVPILSIEKSDNPDPVPAGGTLNYSISVNNTGNATATNVTVMETYDGNVTFVTAVPAPSQGNDTWKFATLNASETRWINISVSVNASVLNGTVLHNVVNVTCDEGVTDFDTEDTTVFVAPILNCTCGDICVNTTGWWRDGGVFNPSLEPIWAAVNSSAVGETICVKDGAYNENVDVNKRLTIRSENGSASTIVNASDSNDHVFEVTANWVNISGFTVQNATAVLKAGIYLGNGVEHCNIYDNKATNNYFGICLWSSDNNNVTNNTCNSNGNSGIYLELSNSNTVSDNVCNQNTWEGIWLDQSSNNAIYNNAANLNNRGIDLELQSNDNIVTNNTCNSNNMLGISLLYDNPGNNNFFADNTASDNTDYDFYSHEDAYNNTVEDLMIASIASFPTTISFTYANGVGLKGVETAPGDPVGKANVSKFVNATEVTAESWIFMNVSYGDADLGDVDEDSLRMWRYNGTDWTEVPAPNGVNTIENYVYANITSFSIFAPLGNVTGAKLEINKTCVPDPVSPGGTLNYTIHVNNTGNGTATNVTVMETYDVNVTFVAAVPAPSLGNDTWKFATLNASETRWINISVTVNASVLNGTVLHNVVNVTCDEGVMDFDTEDTTVFAAPVLNCTCGDICVNTTGWWRDGGAFNASNTPIQHAIDNATAGETVCVKDGTYNENVNVNKRLTVRSENSSANCIVSASNPNDHVFDVTADYVNLSGFTVQNATGEAGIYLGNNVDHCNISDNTASNNRYGIYLGSSNNNTLTSNTANDNGDEGIYLYYSDQNNIINNIANSNDGDGIDLERSDNNNVINNTANLNGDDGFDLDYADNNNITNNNASSNDDDGIDLDNSDYNTLTGNTARGNGWGFYLGGSSYNNLTNNNASSNTDEGINLDQSSNNNKVIDNTVNNNTNDGIDVWRSSNNTLINNTVNSNGEDGIKLDESSNNFVINNTANSNDDDGIYLDSSSYNTLTSNTANNNNWEGILLDSSTYNTLTSNTANNNSRGIYLDFSSNYNTLTSNTANNNNNDGIYSWDSSNNNIINNTANNNGDDGIELASSSYNTIDNNNASNNDYGIYLYSSSYNALTNNTASNNTEYDCYADETSHDNTVKNLAISSYPTTISFTYDNGIKLKSVQTPPADPAGKRNISKYVNVTEVTADSWIFMNVSYEEGDLGGVIENSLRLWKHNGTDWTLVPGTNGVNTAENYVYANITEFSVFAPLGNVTGANLEINKTGVPDPVSPGGTLNYTIHVNNTGNATATNVTVIETYDKNVTFVAAVPAPSLGNDTWQFLTLNASETRWINISVTVNASVLNGTVLHNIVNVTCAEGAMDSDTADTTVLFKELNCTCGDICVNETGWWQDGGAFIASGTPIQDAIDNATAGETICVKNGTYSETVDVTKSHLTIRSENGPSVTTVSASLNPDRHVFNITDQTNVTLKGFEIRDARGTSQSVAGIYMNNACESNIFDNIVTNISATDMWNHAHGIWLRYSSDNSFVTTTVYNLYSANGQAYGIHLSSSSDNNSFVTSTVYNLSANDGVNGIYLEASSDNSFVTSTVYNLSADDIAHGIYLYSSSNNSFDTTTVYNLDANNDAYGIRLYISSDNSFDTSTVYNLSANGGAYGIYLFYSSDNSFISGSISDVNAPTWCDFYSDARSHGNSAENITISSFPTTISFTYDNGVGITGVTTPKPDPAGKANIGKYVNATNVTADSWIFMNVSYEEGDLGGVEENSLRIWKHNGTDWTEVPGTNGVNTAENYVYANITSFSIFAPLGNVTGPKLEINKTDNPDPVSPGGTLNYTIHVNNTGNATATNVTVKETYDGNVTFVTAVPAPAPGNDTWQFATLNASETRWINISVTVNAPVPNGTVLQNIVNVTCDEGVTDTDTEDTTVFAACGDICVNTTGWWRDGGAFNPSNTPIQHAIDNATAGDVICVKDGTYTENVDVHKRLTIRSENGAASTSVQAASSYDYVFEVTADYVNISGFHVTDATKRTSGIYLDGANYCNISDNNANENYYHGIFLNSSSDNTLVNNSALDNSDYGIYLSHSSDNTLVYNTASDNWDYGIYLSSSSNNNLVNNTMTGNRYNFGVSGSTLSHYVQNIDTNNTVDGKPIYYWVDQQNRAIPNDAGYVGVVNSTNITVRDLTLTKNGEGVLFAYTGDSIIENVIVSYYYRDGIYLYSSCNNNITSNTALRTTATHTYEWIGYGIYLNYSSNNTLTDNTASHNWCGIYLEDSNYNTLSDNTANSNSRGGILLEYSSDNTLTNNIANSNCDYGTVPHPGPGIFLSHSSYNELTGNIANWNCMDGISLRYSGNNVLTNNTANENNCFGIRLWFSSYNMLTNNTASNTLSNNIWPRTGTGIYLGSSNSNALTNNNANSNNESGIYLYLDSNNNYLINNTVSGNKGDGFKLESNSSHNRISGNNASDNDNNGIHLYGTTGNPSSHNIVANNTADLNDKSGIMIEGADSDHNTIVNNTCKSNDYGISVRYGDYNNLTMNTCNQNSEYGIRLYQSADNNEITNNTAISNTEYGIYISSSDYNIIYNNYFNNTNNAYDDRNNVWNITKTLGTNIIGGPYLGGNYWSDYAGRDITGDGLGDTLLPYNSSGDITNDGDYHPLVPVGYGPVLSIEKADNTDPVQPGGTLNYTIRVNNTGNATATNVTVMETYDENVTFVMAVPAPSPGNDTWIFATLNASETRWVNISVAVNASAPNGTVLHNIVNVTCDEGVTDSDTENTTVFVTPVLNCTCGDICVNTTGWWRDGGAFNPSNTPIQDAIDNATAGDTICVKDGTYNENVDVTKSHLTIRSENGPSVTTVSASLNNNHVFNITDQTKVTLRGFGICDAHGTSQSVAGIYMDNASECNISGNIVTDISATGWLNDAYGIWLEDSSDNSFTSSTDVSYINTDATWGRMAYGIYIGNSNNNSFSSSTSVSYINSGIMEASGIWLDYSNNNSFGSSTDVSYVNAFFGEASGITLWGSNNNSFSSSTDVFSITASANAYGIRLRGSNNNRFGSSTSISHIDATLEAFGILLGGSNNNRFSSSTSISYVNATDLDAYGIYLWSSSDNRFSSGSISDINAPDWWDFYSEEDAHGNSAENITISSFPTTISFTYDYGIKLKSVETPPADPADKTNISKYVNVTEVTADSWIFMNVSYEDGDLVGVDENSLRLWKHNGTDWTLVPGTNGVNTGENYVYANITEFSVFAPLGNVTGAKLEINKTGVPDPVSPGGTLNYTIHVNNTGNATATNVTVIETYDKNVTFVSAVPVPSPGNDTWEFATLNVSETRRINISVIVNASVPNGTVLHNTVNVSCVEGVTDTDTENTTVFVAPVPVLEITKTDAPDPVSPGGTLNYTISVNNSGNATATNVTVMETYDKNVTFVAAVPAPSSGDDTWQFPTLNVSEMRWINISVIVNASVLNGTVLHNIVNVTCDEGASDSDTENTTVFVAPVPVLEIAKTDAPDPVSPGGTLNYTISVNNTGNATATNVTVMETYDKNVTFVAAVPAPSPGNDTWIFATLNASETRWINISVTVNSSVLNGTVLHNIVNVTCDEGVSDSDTENTTVFVAPVPALEINKTDNPDPVSPGGTLKYSISVNNTGNATATNVTVIETYDKNVTFVAAVPTPSSGDDTWQFPTLNVSETRWINISVIVNASVLNGTVLHNIVNVTCDEGASDSDTENTTVFVAPVPALEINKTDNPDPVSPGGTLKYSISVNNTGNATATNVTVIETYDKNVTFVAAVPTPSSGDDTWQFATLNASETRWINVSVIVNASVLNGTVLHNIVNVSCAEGVTDSDTENTTVFVAPVPVLGITKTDAPDPVSPGGTLNYTIRVNNTGNATATNVSVMETYDKNVTFVAAVPAPSSSDDTWKFATLNVSETRWINISVSVNASVLNGTVLHNIVNVTCDEGVSDSDTADTTVLFKELNCTCGDICVNETGWWSDGGAFIASGTPIQDAIDNATAGETICVKDGIYNENVDVDKRLTIRSENGAASTTVQASNSNDHVFEVTADWVNIRGFTVTGAIDYCAGIYLFHTGHGNISENNASDNFCGIWLSHSSYNSLSGNTANLNSHYGIRLYDSSNYNPLSSNTASNNDYGILLDDSSNNSLSCNTANGNRNDGIGLYNSSNYNSLSSNTASNNYYGLLLESHSSYNSLSNNTASYNDYGIGLYSSSNNNLTGNTAKWNKNDSIRLHVSSNNKLTSNTASNNKYGIHLDASSNNLIYNNYFNNTNNAYDDRNNVWNTTKTLGTNIIGGPYLGGNYWSDYAGRDINGDGLGDTLLPYNSSGDITNDGDYHPLVPVGYAPVLSIEKSDKPDPVSPGGTLNYSIHVNNTGNATATNVTVMETYDENVTFVAAVPAPSSGDDTWQFPTLNASETRWINVSVIVNASVLNGTVLHNIVNVSCAEGVTDTDTENTTVFAIPSIPNVKLSKWVKYKTELESEYRKEIEDAKVCNNVSFKIAVQNNGTGANLTGISVMDVLNCSLGYINGSANIPPNIYEDHCPANQTLLWQFATVWLEPGEYINITFDAHVDECGTDRNYARVDAISGTGCNVSDEDYVYVNCTVPVCVETATGTGIACFATDSGTIEDLIAVDESTLPEEGKPKLVFPHGFFSFNITGLTQGQTVVVTLTLPDNVPVGTEYWKYHASEGGWIRIPMGSDDGDNEITITLVDGGLGDDDGIANGVIVDQGGPGVRATKPKLTKSAPTSVAPGGTITYTILYANVGPVALTDVMITENYPEGVTFISAVPAPDAGTNNMWTIGTLPAGASGQIIIKVKVPDSPDLTFTESGSVTGEGFVMVNKDLSTEQKPYRLKNVVTITCAETDPVSASALTTVSGVPGTSLEITEHGSGIYESEEILNFGTKNKSIRLQKSTEAEYQPTSFNFSDGFSVVFTNMCMQDICSKNMVLGDAMHKKIKDATYIKDDTKTETGEYGTELEFASSFHGAAHIGAVSKDVTTSEDYIGEFEIFWAAKEECQYLFNWSRVPGNDSDKLIRFLVDNLAITWAENATITKSDDDRVINISTDWRSAEVILAANNETATVKVANEAIYVLDVRTEDGTLNVYDCRLRKISESVTGEGYVMVDKELTSGHIQVVEHGSGIYTSDTDFDSQRLNKSTEAEYQPTTFNFSDGFGVNFSSNWMQGICSKDKKAGTAIHKKISDATSIADDTTATKSSMAFETSFNGSIHVGARTTGTRISEDYIGWFNVSQVIKIGDARSTSTSNSSNSSDLPSCP